MTPEIVQSTAEMQPFTLWLWTPSESDDELLHLWESMNTGEQLPAIKASHRKREWLSSRILLRKLNLESIHFLDNGKPVLEAGAVSISHCRGSVAVVTADRNIGLDIQLPTEQISTIRSKFCSPAEWDWIEKHDEPLRALTIAWSAKEAIFKYWGEHVEFAADIEVLPFQCNDAVVLAQYTGTHGSRKFSLWHTTRDRLEIVVAI